MTNVTEKQIQHASELVWLRGDFSPLSPDFLNHDPPPGLPPTRDGLRQLRELMFQGFSDFAITLEDVVVGGDRCASRLSHRGTHDGPFMGIEPTGRQVTWQTIEIVRLEHRLIVERWGITDGLSLLGQLGALGQ